MSKQDHTYLNIGENRGSPRIYIQGLTLPDHGFIKGAKYFREPDYENNVIRLRADPEGDKTVTGKQNGRLSVIDINNQEIAKVFVGADSVRIDIHDGLIEISVDHLYQKQLEREAAWHRAVRDRKVTKGSLCSGIGMSTLGLHDGFKKHGIELDTKWLVDREAKYLQVAY